VRGEFDAGLLVALVRIGLLRLPLLPPTRMIVRSYRGCMTKFAAKARELIEVQHDDKAANLLRLLGGAVPPLRVV
jgi:hypothetical protein